MPSYNFRFKYELPLSDEHYMALGEVAATWQYLELAVQGAIWATLGLESEQGCVATASLRFDTHLEIMGVLGHALQQPEFHPVNLRDLIKETKALQGERNTVIHGLWVGSQMRAGDPVGLIQPEARRLKIKDATKPAPRYTAEQITAIAERIYEAHLKWRRFAAARNALRQIRATQARLGASPPS